VPLCPENGITFEDIGRIFGPPVFGGPVPAARRMMIWFLKRWNRVSEGLLDAEPDGAAASSSSSLPLSRRDVRVLERMDSFELLAPDEQEEDEQELRVALADPEERRGHHPVQIEGANPPAPSSQSQIRSNLDDPGFATQETVMTRSGPPDWPSEAKGKGRECSVGPDDSMSEVPRRDGLPQSNPQSIEAEALLPPHLFAPTSRRQSMRSPESRYSDESESHSARAGEDSRQWRATDAQLLIALSRLHEARARIDELEIAVADAATQSERARDKLMYVAAVTANDMDSCARFEQELKLTALDRDEANELVKNICAVLNGVVRQQAVCAEAG